MTETNGINAMIAHRQRVADPNIYAKSIVEGYTFAIYGKVVKYTNERVDVMCGSLKFTNVEVLVFGVNGWGIKPVPAVGDRVLLISSQSPILDIKKFSADSHMPPYDPAGLKAIPLTDSNTAQLITVDKTKVELTGKNTFTLNDAGFTFQDANGNKGTTSDTGVELEDKNGNKITTDNTGVVFEDKNGNKITTDDSGVVFEDKNDNKVTTDSSGVAFEDKNGNKVTTDDSGVAFEDKNDNKVTTDNSGIVLEDKNGNKYTGSSTGIEIKDKNNHKVTTAAAGITLEVNNGSKIALNAGNVTINNKFMVYK